jgi:hypothetical protein
MEGTVAYRSTVPYVASMTSECPSGCAATRILNPCRVFLPPRGCKRKEPRSGNFRIVPTAPPLCLYPLTSLTNKYTTRVAYCHDAAALFGRGLFTLSGGYNPLLWNAVGGLNRELADWDVVETVPFVGVETTAGVGGMAPERLTARITATRSGPQD